jgi:hypothetical protein
MSIFQRRSFASAAEADFENKPVIAAVTLRHPKSGPMEID